MADELELLIEDHSKALNENRILRAEIDRQEGNMKSKTEKIVDMVYYAFMVIFCSVAFGYGWCWIALH